MLDLFKSKMMISFFIFMIGVTIFDCICTNKKNNINYKNCDYLAINNK